MKEKEYLRLFLRFLKNRNYYPRFINCISEYPTRLYTLDNFFKHLYEIENIVEYSPFTWIDSDKEADNYSAFWGKVHQQWYNLCTYDNASEIYKLITNKR